MQSIVAPIIAAVLTAWLMSDGGIRYPHWVFLGIVAAVAYSLTGAHLKRRGDKPLQRFLQDGPWDRFYRDNLTAILDWIDHKMAPPEMLDRSDAAWREPPATARDWNWRAYDRMLLIAVVYPILLPLLIWVATGTSANIGGLEILTASTGFRQQAFAGGMFAVLIVNRPLGGWLNRAVVLPFIRSIQQRLTPRSPFLELDPRIVQAVLVASVAAAFAYEYSFSPIGAVSGPRGIIAGSAAFAMLAAYSGLSGHVTMRFLAIFAAVVVGVISAWIVAFSTAITGFGMIALAGSVASAVAIFSVFFGNITGSFSSAFATAIPVAFGLMTFRYGIEVALALSFTPVVLVAAAVSFRWHPGVFYIFGTGVALGLVCLAATQIGSGWIPKASSLLLFLGLFPILNAIWDFASVGLTRWCLRHSIMEQPLGRLPAAFRPLWFNLLDLSGAVVALVGLIVSLVLGVWVLNHLAPQPILSPSQVIVQLREGPGGPDMRWLPLMVFSTLLPTVAHLALLLISVPMRFPGKWLSVLLAQRIPLADEGDDYTVLICAVMAAWATLIAAIPVLGYVYLWPARYALFSSLSGWVMEMVARFVALLA